MLMMENKKSFADAVAHHSAPESTPVQNEDFLSWNEVLPQVYSELHKLKMSKEVAISKHRQTEKMDTILIENGDIISDCFHVLKDIHYFDGFLSDKAVSYVGMRAFAQILSQHMELETPPSSTEDTELVGSDVDDSVS